MDGYNRSLEAQIVELKDKLRMMTESRDYWFEQYKTTTNYARSKIERAVLDCIVHTFENDHSCAEALLALQQRVIQSIDEKTAAVMSGAPAPVLGDTGCAKVLPVPST